MNEEATRMKFGIGKLISDQVNAALHSIREKECNVDENEECAILRVLSCWLDSLVKSRHSYARHDAGFQLDVSDIQFEFTLCRGWSISVSDLKKRIPGVKLYQEESHRIDSLEKE